MMKHEMNCKMIKLEAGVEVIMTEKHNSSVVTLYSENKDAWLHVSRMKTLTVLSIKRGAGLSETTPPRKPQVKGLFH